MNGISKEKGNGRNHGKLSIPPESKSKQPAKDHEKKEKSKGSGDTEVSKREISKGRVPNVN